MEVRRIPDHYWCSVCDERPAVAEIGSDGHLKPFWASGITDYEITLCRECLAELVEKLTALDEELRSEL